MTGDIFSTDTASGATTEPPKATAAKVDDRRNDTVSVDSVAQDQLRAFVERIERMEEEKKAISDDIREIYTEAKGNGFDTKVLRQLVKIRKQDHDERMEQEAMLHLYMVALGMEVEQALEDAD